MTELIVSATRLSREYRLGAETVHALREVDFTVETGEFVALLGRSGSGKSTLLNLLGGLDQPTRGSIVVAGRELAALNATDLSLYRRTTVGFIFQSFNLVTSLRAWENVALPLVFQGVGRLERKRRAHELLDSVGLGKRTNHVPSQMSGGEQQRVAIARALVNSPRMLLCDEPTGNLDARSAQEVLTLLARLNKEHGKTIVMVTHDPHAAHFASKIRHLDKGELLPEGEVPEDWRAAPMASDDKS